MLITPQSQDTIEVDAATLSPEEWFTIYAVNGLSPDASYSKMTEFRRVAFGKSRLEQQQLLRNGMESLIARGLFGPATDKEGNVVTDQKGDVVYEAKGKLVYRVREVKNPASSM